MKSTPSKPPCPPGAQPAPAVCSKPDPYALYPAVDLLARWEGLPRDLKVYARGYLGSALEKAEAVLNVCEQMAADRAAEAKASRVQGPSLRLVVQ